MHSPWIAGLRSVALTVPDLAAAERSPPVPTDGQTVSYTVESPFEHRIAESVGQENITSERLVTLSKWVDRAVRHVEPGRHRRQRAAGVLGALERGDDVAQQHLSAAEVGANIEGRSKVGFSEAGRCCRESYEKRLLLDPFGFKFRGLDVFAQVIDRRAPEICRGLLQRAPRRAQDNDDLRPPGFNRASDGTRRLCRDQAAAAAETAALKASASRVLASGSFWSSFMATPK
mgnify:CR=1 FL=1